MNAGEPMVRLSRSSPPSGPSWLLTLAVIAGLSWGGWYVAASAYRAQHCVLFLGHWLSVERATNPLFCQ